MTGVTGYVGSRLARLLLDAGWVVHGITRPDSDHTRPPAGVPCHVHDNSAVSVAQIVADVAPDVVFHLASRVQAQHSLTNLDDIVAANVGFGAQLLEGMALAGARRLVSAGSYWEFDADGNYNPNSFYAATKHAFRAMVEYFVERHRFSSTTLLLYDVYGPEDWRGKYLSQLVDALKRDKPMAATPGEQVLAFVHVDDTTRGFLVAAQMLMRTDTERGSRCYRLDSDRRVTLREASTLMARLAGRPERVQFGKLSYPPHQIMEPLSVGPRLPEWSQQVSLENGFRMLLAEAGLVAASTAPLP